MPRLHLTVKVGETLSIPGVGKITVEHKTGQRTKLAIDIENQHKIELLPKDRPEPRDWRT